jgi:hypothetical protein
MLVQTLTAPEKELEASRQAALVYQPAGSSRRVFLCFGPANQRCNQNLTAFGTRLPGYRLVFKYQ